MSGIITNKSKGSAGAGLPAPFTAELVGDDLVITAPPTGTYRRIVIRGVDTTTTDGTAGHIDIIAGNDAVTGGETAIGGTTRIGGGFGRQKSGDVFLHGGHSIDARGGDVHLYVGRNEGSAMPYQNGAITWGYHDYEGTDEDDLAGTTRQKLGETFLGKKETNDESHDEVLLLTIPEASGVVVTISAKATKSDGSDFGYVMAQVMWVRLDGGYPMAQGEIEYSSTEAQMNGYGVSFIGDTSTVSVGVLGKVSSSIQWNVAIQVDPLPQGYP